jgi:branched-subunit amino acid permease
LCEEQESSSLSKFVGWGLIIIVGLAIIYFFMKYQGAKRRKNPTLRELGLKK